MERTSGTVKWFNRTKGYGFIARDDEDKDVFIHVNDLRMSGFNSLEEEQRINFTVVQGEKGPRAQDVELIT